MRGKRGSYGVMEKFQQTKDQKIFQNEKPSQTPKNVIIKVIKQRHNNKLNN